MGADPRPTPPDDEAVLTPEGLDALIDALRAQGRQTLGPVVRDGAVALGELHGVEDLPRGWGDVQGPGSYRIERRHDEAMFSWAVGPQSAKATLFPPAVTEWRARQVDGVPVVEEEPDALAPLAFVGLRPCELTALGVLDAVLDTSSVPDPRYRRRRRSALVVVVECGTPAGTCFCSSMGSGPAADNGFDLALTELLDDDGGHRFLARAGSAEGAA